ncbi:MAG: DNA polymerase III subunit gamma/tau, partial [Oscillospiraceae bacterium]
GVDSIRSLIEEAAFTPGSAKYRVYIIDEVHMLSDAAFNALLKTLEEPPAHVIFILATTEVHKLLPTILSRCQRFDFKRIAPDDIADRLTYIAEKEEASIDRDAALLIARLSDGGMRDAVSLLDQCIGRSAQVQLDTVNAVAGVAGREHIFTIAGAITDGDSVLALETINRLHENSKDMGRLCEEIAVHFRNLMLIKTMGDQGNMVAVSQEEREQLTKQALSTRLSTILHALDTFQRTFDKMRYANQRIELEMAIIRLCSPELDSTPEALIRRIEALEDRKSAPVSSVDAPSPRPASATPENQEYSSPTLSEKAQESDRDTPLSIEELSVKAKRFNQWPEVIHIIKSFSMTVGMAFANSSAYVSDNYMLIDGSKLAFEYLRKNPTYKDKLREAIYQVAGKNYRLGPFAGSPRKDDDPEDPIAALIQKAEAAGIQVNEIE